MKTQIFKLATIFFIFISTGSFVYSQVEEKKNIHKEFTPNELSLLDINNKFGNITVKDWDNNNATVDIEIIVKAQNPEKAQKILSLIDVEYTDADNIFKFVTKMDESVTKNSSPKSEFKVNYVVNMPRNLKLNIDNRFGDVFVNEIHGKSNISVKFGSLRAEKLIFDDSKPLSRITVSYGDCSIEKTSWMTLISSYSNSVIKEATALVIVSRYSDVSVNKANSIVSEAKYDNYRLGALNNLNVKAKYTDFKIERINRKLDFEIKYGDCEVKQTSADFESVTINAEYADIDLYMPASASYQLNAGIEFGEIELPKNANLEKHNSVTSAKVTGVVGPDAGTKAIVTINCSFGDIELGQY
jgi:hypothetical protein